MNKKENRMAVRQTVEKAVIRDEQNRRIQSAATNPVKEVLKILHTTLRGVRSRYRIRKPFQIRYEQSHPRKKEIPGKTCGGCIYQPFYCYFILPCFCFHDYGYDFPVFFTLWKRTRGL